LKDHDYHDVSEYECAALVRFFDSDSDGALSFQDFLQIVLPCEDNLLRNVVCDRPAFRVSRYDSLPYDIERSFKDLVMSELALYRRLECLRKELESRFDYSTLAAYRTVDKNNDGNINIKNIGSYLRACGHYAQDKELV